MKDINERPLLMVLKQNCKTWKDFFFLNKIEIPLIIQAHCLVKTFSHLNSSKITQKVH